MARLGTTVSRLLRQQANWHHNLPEGLDLNALPQIRGDGRLEEFTETGANPGNLRAFRYTPAKVSENPALVVVLHGCTQRAAAYADGAGWVELADRFGFCLLLPEQRRSNNPNLCFNWFVPGDTTRGSGEVHSIRQMIASTVAEWEIDEARIFVTGLSAGGAMTSAMLATYPEVFAGGATIAGLPFQSASDIPGAFQVMAEGRTLEARDWGNHVKAASTHAGPWPKVSIWHGSADQTVNPRNAAETVKQWSTLHETSQRPDLEEKHSNHIRRVWNGKDGSPAVEEYVVLDMGHGTPLATGSGDEHFGATAPYLLEAGLSSSHRIADFWGIAQTPSSMRPSRSQASSGGAANDGAEILPRITGQIAIQERAPRRQERTASREEARSHRADIGSIINRALKSAGLLR